MMHIAGSWSQAQTGNETIGHGPSPAVLGQLYVFEISYIELLPGGGP